MLSHGLQNAQARDHGTACHAIGRLIVVVGIGCYTQAKKRAAERVANARRKLGRLGRKPVLHQGSSLRALSELPVRTTIDVACIDGDHSALGAARSIRASPGRW